MPRKINYIEAYLSPEEIHQIYNAINEENDIHAERDKLFLRAMWETGGRVQEIANLIAVNMDLKLNIITLKNLKQEKRKPLVDEHSLLVLDSHGKKTFPKQKEPPTKDVQLSDKSTLIADLIDYCNRNEINPKSTSLIFCGNRDNTKPLNSLYIWRLVAGVKTKVPWSDKFEGKDGMSVIVGVFRAKKDKNSGRRRKPAWPHLFRHSRAQYILAKTGRLELVKEHLGHANLETTKEYIEVTNDIKKKYIGGLPE